MSPGGPRVHPYRYTRAAWLEYPDPRQFTSIVDILDDAASRYPESRPTLSLRTDDGIDLAWSAAELRRRARLAAWRLRAAGLQPGDRLMTWSPPTPRLPAVFWGAAMGRIVLVPLDLRMAPAVLKRIADRAGHVAHGARHRAGRTRSRWRRTRRAHHLRPRRADRRRRRHVPDRLGGAARRLGTPGRGPTCTRSCTPRAPRARPRA